MENLGSFFLGVIATFIGISMNHAYTKRRLSNKDYKDKLELIFHNLYVLESLYSDCWGACSEYDFNKYEDNRIKFFDKHRETYHIIYLYFDDLYQLYNNNFDPIIDKIDGMNKIFSKRKINDDLSFERNKLDEFLYDIQPYMIYKNLFFEMYRVIKYKISNPEKVVDLERLDIDKIPPYIINRYELEINN